MPGLECSQPKEHARTDLAGSGLSNLCHLQFVETLSKPFAGVAEGDTESSGLAPKLEPWTHATFAGFAGGIRRHEHERLVMWCNYVPQGVVSAYKQVFTVDMITQLCHQMPRTSVAVVILPNRGGDLRSDLRAKTLWCTFVPVVPFKVVCVCF